MFKVTHYITIATGAIGLSIIANLLTATIQKQWGPDNVLFTDYLFSHTEKYFPFYIFSIIIITLTFGTYKTLNQKLKNLMNYSRMARLSGLDNILTYMGDDFYEKLSEFKEDIQGSCKNQNEITIVSASGLLTFGSEESLLGDTLDTIKKQITVFLLDPSIDCNATNIRADCLKIKRPDLRASIVKSISYLKEIQSKNHVNIKVYLYKCAASFGVVSSNGRTWVRLYGKFSNIKESTVFGFKTIEPASDIPKNLHCFFDGHLASLLLKNIGNSSLLNNSISLIEDINTWEYPGDLSSLNIHNMKPCRRTIPDRRGRITAINSANNSKNTITRVLKDRRGTSRSIIEFMEKHAYK